MRPDCSSTVEWGTTPALPPGLEILFVFIPSDTAATVQPCNRSGSGRIWISSGSASPGTSRAGRPLRSSRFFT